MYVAHRKMLLVTRPKEKTVHGRRSGDQSVAYLHGVARMKPGQIFAGSLSDDCVKRDTGKRGKNCSNSVRL